MVADPSQEVDVFDRRLGFGYTDRTATMYDSLLYLLLLFTIYRQRRRIRCRINGINELYLIHYCKLPENSMFLNIQ